MWSRCVRRSAVVAAVAMLCLAGGDSAAFAQYFGQNKVQYREFDFHVLKTQHFDIYFYPREQAGVELAARFAERWYGRLSKIFGHQLRGRQPLVLYASPTDFQQTNVIQGELGEGVGGVTEPLRRRIVLPFGGALADTDHVIGHELVHAFQYDMTMGEHDEPGMNGAERLPLWFIEGMAEYLSIGPVDPNTAMWLRDAAHHDKLPTIRDLDDPKYFPYRWGQAFWAYVGGRWGDDVIPRLLTIGAAARDMDVLFKQVLGVDAKTLSRDWQASIRQTYGPVLEATSDPAAVGRTVIRGSGEGAGFASGLNVGPSISPDGKWLAFLSQRSVFSTDLYVANAQTGEIVHRLTRTATDPHYTSIQFIYSAGAWDRASTRIAIATVAGGNPALAIFNGVTGDKEREIPIESIDEILNPTWSPDDNAICFTGMSQGITDLYVYDLRRSQLRRLTNDAFSDMQPAWSPDGRRIAFSTDRFTTTLSTLAIGPLRLATIDPATGTIEPVVANSSGDAINPSWPGNSSSLLFVSNQTGIPNLYRVALQDGGVTQLTNISTGLSGITATSPALSVAAGTGTAVFSVYDQGNYSIAALPRDAAPPATTRIVANAAVLPPVDRKPSTVAALLDNSRIGLPESQQFPVSEYKPSLQLEQMGQPMVGVGVNRFGTALGGGVSFLFSDMLNTRSLGVALELNSGYGGNFDFKNTAVQAVYLNQQHRWNWGGVVGQVPYMSGGFVSTVGQTNQGELVQVDQSLIFRQTERSAAGLTYYPFNRAQRLEFQAGATNISFDQIVDTTVTSLETGLLLSDDTKTTSLGRSLTLGNTSMAFVSDTSNFGATSPVAGERYRLEVAPAFGTINFTSALADYRRYFTPAPFYTFAVRAMHYGRYGGGGEDPRLYPLYIGDPTLVRGYDASSFDASDCVPTATSDCPAIDRLLGSRMLVTNLEFRFPLLRPFGLSENMYGPVPVEVGFFTDAGVAWNSGERPSIFGGSRKGVWSAGIALRVNMLGFAIGEFDFARPFQRPGQGWVFQFNLTPGF